MLYCSLCGTGLHMDARFCPECGTKTETADALQIIKEDKKVSELPDIVLDKPLTSAEITSLGKADQDLLTNPKQFCRNCGKEVQEGAFGCLSCGLPPLKASNFCPNCGTASHPEAVICIKCGISFEKKKILTPNSAPISSASFQPKPAPGFVSIGAFWGSLLVIVGFFTNWLKFGEFGGLSGFKILTTAGDSVGSGIDNDSTATVATILLGAIFLSAIICFLYSVKTGVGNRAYLFFKVLPVISLLIIGGIIGSKAGVSESNYGEEIFQIIGMGVYFTAGGAIILALSKPRE